VYDKPKVKPIDFAGALPDEFAFSIASILCEHYPHQDNFLPIYWPPLETRNEHTAILANDYYAYSAGGNIINNVMKENYNRLVSIAYYNMKLTSYPFKHKDKRTYLTERNKF
jgi:hypothetical protein